MNTARLVLLLLLISCCAFGQSNRTQQRDPVKCNAEARGYWDAPPEFWETFWKECPPEQVGSLDGEPVYAARADLRPKLKVGSVPTLPSDSQRRIAEVTLSVTISKTGSVNKAIVTRTCGDKELDDKAVDVVKAWRFIPATRDNKAVNVNENLIVRFERSEDK